MNNNPSLDTIVSLCKRRGFVYPTSEIYGGLANTYDLGPLGAQLMKNIKDSWWREFVTKRVDMVGLDSAIIQHPTTWVASGHVDSFNDPLVEDTKSHKRYRADHLIEAWQQAHPEIEELQGIAADSLSVEEMAELIKTHQILSKEGNPVTEPKAFNLLFETAIGVVADEKSKVYLRGETAQGIFANFKNILDSTRVKMPFGVAQLGKSFRNEITTGQFVFRTLEFEQAEIEYFFNPSQSDWQELFATWQDQMWSFVTKTLGVNPDHLNWREHSDAERSHYSLKTLDLDYQFPFGSKELWGLAYRTDYDLKQHIEHSGKDLQYRDPHTGESFIPHVIEPALGVARAFLMVLCDSYVNDGERSRVFLKLKPSLAPYQVAVFPLLKNRPELVERAYSVFDKLSTTNNNWQVAFDDRGNIGKRYLSQDEIGTPFCVTIDFETLENDTVTIRHRDTTEQERLPLARLPEYLTKMIG